MNNNNLTVENYQKVIQDNEKLVHELDILLNGKFVAPAASLCDIISQVKQQGIVAKHNLQLDSTDVQCILKQCMIYLKDDTDICLWHYISDKEFIQVTETITNFLNRCLLKRLES